MTTPTDPRVRQWTTGPTIPVDNIDRIPKYDERSGDHLWIWTAAFRANPTAETPMLDGENLLCIAGPGCFHCEQEYSPRLATRRCAGHP